MKRLAIVSLTLFVLFIIIPFIPLFFWSFSMSWRWPDLFPMWGLRAWAYLFSVHSGTLEAIMVSMQIALMTTLINFVLAIPVVYALVRYSFIGKQWVEALLFAPLIVPPFVAIMGMDATLIRWNLSNTLTGVILVHIIPTLPYLLRPLLLQFRTLGTEWEDQARMLGANWFQRFCHVVFPYMLPAIIAGGSLSILVSLSQYLITLLVGGGVIQTLPLLMFPFISGGDPAIGAGYSILFVLMSIFTLWLMEWILKKYNRKQTWIYD